MEKTIVHFFDSDVVTDGMLHDYIYVHRENITGAAPVNFFNDRERMAFFYHGCLPDNLDGWAGERKGILLEERDGRKTIFATWADSDEIMESFINGVLMLLNDLSLN